MPFQESQQNYFQQLDQAQWEIFHIIFPARNPTLENIAQIRPIVQTKTIAPDEENEFLDFEIVPHHKSLSLNALRLYKIAKYNLHFNDLRISNFSKIYFDLLKAINNITETLDLDIWEVTLPYCYDYHFMQNKISEVSMFSFEIRSKKD